MSQIAEHTKFQTPRTITQDQKNITREVDLCPQTNLRTHTRIYQCRREFQFVLGIGVSGSFKLQV